MARSSFWERFGYAIWIRHLRTGEAPTFAEIGRAAGGLTGQGVSGWKGRDKPPANYELHKPLALFFDVAQDWLIADEGDPPRAELWDVWVKERRRRPAKLSGGIPAPKASKKDQRESA